MTPTHIEADALRDGLEAQQPVTVVDIRTDDDYAQWAIPGKTHVQFLSCSALLRRPDVNY